MIDQRRVNTDQWNNNYKKLIEFRIGKFFKNNAIRATKFYDIVQDRQARILDVGCGSARFLASLKERGFSNLFGIEPERELTKDVPEGIRIVNCPAEHILFDDNKFDVVIIYGVLHHLKGRESWRKSFNEIDRVLKSKGYLFIVEPCNPFVFRILEFSCSILGLVLGSLRMLGEIIKDEKKELYDFMANYRIYEGFIYEKKYNIIVNKRTIFRSPLVQWILTVQKQ